MQDKPLNTRLSWRIKRLRYLLQRARGSLALRGWRGTLARVGQEFQHRPELDDSLALLSLDEAFVPFAMPSSTRPRVSLIIPIHGKLSYTIACLRSVARHASSTPFEVIVVDDASPDESADNVSRIDGVRLLRNPENLGFIGSCNAGAAEATGDFLLFLNNDTQVTPDWMDALLRCFDDAADCGIAGSQLIYPDGRLQEAGGLVFSDGACWNYGRFEPRTAPAFRYRRSTDFVSGAALMIRSELFQGVGGFDARYAPAYYEDVDLAFAVRKLGLQVYYQPLSKVVHCEGISAGTDLDSGMKHHQRLNQVTLVDKWPAALADQPAPGTSLQRAIHCRSRGRILVIDTMTPEPARDSGSLRLTEILQLLQQQGWSTSFLPDDGRASSREIDALGALGCEVLCRPWVKSVPAWLRENGATLHTVILCRHTVAGQYVEVVRQHAAHAKLLFDTVDLHFLREQRAARLTGNAAMARMAEKSRRSELALIAKCDVTFVVSPHEKTMLTDLLPQARVELLSNIHHVQIGVQPYAGRRDLVFIGGFGHPPNGDAVRWIATEILPRLRQRWPHTSVHILGDLPASVPAELAVPGLLLHGRVAELAPWLDSCLASLAPLRFGAGVKGKINMAMSYGLPVIATTLAIEGMQLGDETDVLIANDAEAIVDAVARLQTDAALWQKLSGNALANVQQHFSAQAAAETLRRVLA